MDNTARKLGHGSVENFDYMRAFSRNIGLFSEYEQQLLRNKTVAIPGCGGVGGIHALTLARAGVGRFVIADFDQFDIENMNRQFGAKYSTIGRPKVDVIAEEIKEINPEAVVTVFNRAIDRGNVDDFLSGVDAVADSLDFFAFDARETLYGAARRLGIPIVSGGPLGFSCALVVFTKNGMSFSDYFNIKINDSPVDKAVKFFIGLSPRATQLKYWDSKKTDLNSGKGPSSSVGVTMCASMVSCEVIKLLLGRGPVRPAPHYCQFDAYRRLFRSGWLPWGNRNPLQRLKIWYVKKFILRAE